MNKLAMKFYKPAAHWVEALPLGNGRIGAMVFGRTDEELISLNEDTLWSGYPHDWNENGRYVYVEEAKKLVMENKFSEAQKILEQNVCGKFTQAYMPMGDIAVKLGHNDYENYVRSLDLNTAVSSAEYTCGGVKYKRESFVSAPAQAFIMRFEADKPNSLSMEISFNCQLKFSAEVIENSIEIEAQCPSNAEPSYVSCEKHLTYSDKKEEKGIRYCSIVKAVNEGETVLGKDGKVVVENATAVTLFMTVRSNFAGFDKHPEFAQKPYIEPCREDMRKVSKRAYSELKAEHIADYKKYYDRFDFSLGEDEFADVSMYDRLRNFAQTRQDKNLPVYLLQFGRYLIISSSRPGTTATNLQGIWNNDVTPPWSSNYTININTEMNYWPVFMCNLAEFNEPMISLIKEMSIAGKETAKEYYNAPGFVSHHNTDIWRLSNPVGNRGQGCAVWAFWQMSSGWLCEHLFEQYEFTLDKEFLKNTAYPIMKEAAKFYLSGLTEDSDGTLIYALTTSPENAFIYNGEYDYVAKTTTMTMSIIKELFSNCVKACDIIGSDDEFKSKLEEILPKLSPFKVGSDGRLLEWSEEYTEADKYHRHISHLYGLHPARLITPDKTPELAQACKKVLETKGLTGTGWSLGWKVNQWARLLDGNTALKLLKQQLTFIDPNLEIDWTAGGSYPNLFDAHPPFQIDGNFGVAAGICEMLMQSYDNVVMLLPALPDEWDSGEVSGICAKNGVTADLKWENGALTYAKLSFKFDAQLEIKYSGTSKKVSAKAGDVLQLV